MDIKQKDRSTLKSYFVKNSIPTEENFANLIDSLLSVKDDGLIKPAADPLSIEASGDDGSQKKALNFYRNFSDAQPDWVLSLNPRTQADKPDSARRGFGITDGSGGQRLFIDLSTGNVGIGVNTPTSKLTVAGNIRSAQDSSETNYAEIGHGGSHAYLNAVGVGRLDFRHHGKNKMVLTDTGRLGLATETPQDTLDINGKLVFNGKSTRRVYGAARANHETVVMTGHWDELEIKGRVIDWTGTNLHIGYDNNHSSDAIYLGNNKLNEVAIQANKLTVTGTLLFSNNTKRQLYGAKRANRETVVVTGHWNELEIKGRIIDWTGGNLRIGYDNNYSNYSVVLGNEAMKSVIVEAKLLIAKKIQTEGPQVAFSAYLASNSQSGTKNTLALTAVQKNTGNAYNSSSSKFTAPIKGLYLFTMSVHLVDGSNVSWFIMVNSQEANRGGNTSAENNERAMLRNSSKGTTSSRTCLIQLEVNDQVWIKQTGGRCDNYQSGWEGVLIS
jgi:hypothetical protein